MHQKKIEMIVMSFPKAQVLGSIIPTTKGAVKVCAFMTMETLRTLGKPDQELWIYEVRDLNTDEQIYRGQA